MSNPVFDDALAAMARTFAIVDAEVGRLRTLGAGAREVALQTQAHLESLKKNEGDLNMVVSNLAQKVASSKEAIANAESEARDIVARARTLANTIVSGARADATGIADAAKKDADAVRTVARNDLNSIQGKVEDARKVLEESTAAHQQQLDHIARIKKYAAEFAAQ